jgi:hypothetical protein
MPPAAPPLIPAAQDLFLTMVNLCGPHIKSAEVCILQMKLLVQLLEPDDRGPIVGIQ